MPPYPFRTLGLLIAAALLGNTQCYGTCGLGACKTPAAPLACHHHKAPAQKPDCPHRDADWITAEPANANLGATMVISATAVQAPSGGPAPITAAEPWPPAADGFSPGTLHSPTLLILRI